MPTSNDLQIGQASRERVRVIVVLVVRRRGRAVVLEVPFERVCLLSWSSILMMVLTFSFSKMTLS